MCFPATGLSDWPKRGLKVVFGFVKCHGAATQLLLWENWRWKARPKSASVTLVILPGRHLPLQAVEMDGVAPADSGLPTKVISQTKVQWVTSFFLFLVVRFRNLGQTDWFSSPFIILHHFSSKTMVVWKIGPSLVDTCSIPCSPEDSVACCSASAVKPLSETWAVLFARWWWRERMHQEMSPFGISAGPQISDLSCGAFPRCCFCCRMEGVYRRKDDFKYMVTVSDIGEWKHTLKRLSGCIYNLSNLSLAMKKLPWWGQWQMSEMWRAGDVKS